MIAKNPDPNSNSPRQVPQQRVVILGASNVVLGLPTVIETACGVWGRPLELMAAIGHGRSYGLTTTVLGRTLPGILQCDLWQEWQAREPLPTASLVTDIGNDILFGASPEQIAKWVRQCLTQLAQRSERLIITELPLESVTPIGPQRYLLLRSILFPRSRLTWEQALSRGHQLNEALRELAREFNAALVKPKREWYGFDPIHIMMQQQQGAWREILQSWSGDHGHFLGTSLLNRPGWRLARPKYRKILGLVQHCQQPARCATDGTSLSVY